MPIARSTLTGVAAGVVLLAGAIGFGVGLPEVIDDPGATTAELPTLPERLDDRFIALQAITPEQIGATPDQAEQFKVFTEQSLASETKARESLAEQYGDAAVRAYAAVPDDASAPAQSAPAQIAVTVVPGDAGLLTPRGPFAIENAALLYELEEIDGHRCAVTVRATVDQMTGQPTGQEPTAADHDVTCRAERDGLAYELSSSGLLPEEAVAYLDKTLELTEQD